MINGCLKCSNPTINIQCKGVHWRLTKINRLYRLWRYYLRLGYALTRAIPPLSVSLSLLRANITLEDGSSIGHKAFDPNIGTAKTPAENNLHAGTRSPPPPPPLSLCRRYSECEIISPPLIHAQPAGSRASQPTLPPSLTLLSPPSSSSNSVQSDPNERITRNYDIVRNKFRGEPLSSLIMGIIIYRLLIDLISHFD